MCIVANFSLVSFLLSVFQFTLWRGYNSFIFSLLFFSSFLLTLCATFKIIVINLIICSSFVHSAVDNRRNITKYSMSRFFFSFSIQLLLDENCGQQTSLSPFFLVIRYRSAFAQCLVFFFYLYIHEYKTTKHLFCFVTYNVNGIFLSLLWCVFFHQTHRFCLFLSSLFVLFDVWCIKKCTYYQHTMHHCEPSFRQHADYWRTK